MTTPHRDDARPEPTFERKSGESSPERTPYVASGWLWHLVMGGCVALVGFSTVGLLLAMAGAFETWLACLLAAPIVAMGWAWMHTVIPRSPWTVDRWSILALVLVALITFTIASVAGQHVLTHRDPGSYLTTGRWLARTGSLTVDPVTSELQGLDVSYTGPAVYIDGDQLEPQFSHGPAVVYGAAFEVAGARGLFTAPAAIGALALLATYLAIVVVAGRPGLALAATAALGLSIPFLFVTRNTYSEPFVLALLMAALALLGSGGVRSRPDRLAFACILVGTCVLFRIDAQLYVIGVLGVVAVAALRGMHLRWIAACLAGALLPTAIGRVDVDVFAGFYTRVSLAGNVRLLTIATGLAVVGVLIGWLWGRHGGHRLLDAIGSLAGRRAASVAIAFVVVGAGLFGWLLRPQLFESRGAWDPDSAYARYVGAVQQLVGEPVDMTRSYSEHSLRLLGWYFGPILIAFALVGLAVLVIRGARQLDGPFGRLLAMIAVGVPLYLWDWKITPDQPWVSRRFTPFIIPVFLMAWSLGVAVVARGVRRRSPAVAHIVAAVAVVLLVAPTAVITWPVRDMAEQRGWYGSLLALCERLPADATALTFDNGITSMALRAWCGVDVAAVAPADRATVSAYIERIEERCEAGFLLGRNDADLDPFRDDLAAVDHVLFLSEYNLRPSLTEAPDSYETRRITVVIGELALPSTCRP